MGRYIPHKLYEKLKRRNKCARCGKRVNPKKERLEIHHIRRLKDGGTNQENNLRVVCHSCHKILDNIEFVKHLVGVDKEEIQEWQEEQE